MNVNRNAADPVAHRASAFDLVAAQPWAITTEMLQTISAIARRENESVDAVEARLGHPLQNTYAATQRDQVALIPIRGPVFRYANLMTETSGCTSLEFIARDLGAAIENPAISAIVLDIDSPGGQATGIAEFAQMVRASRKPVVAYVGGSAASAAYWIASAAQSITISKTGIVGSIGAVLSVDPGRSQNGPIEIVSSQSPNKRADVTTEAGRARIQQMVDALAQVFIEDVAAYRRVSVSTVLSDFGQGGVFLGADAVTAGMVDQLGSLEELIAELNAGKMPAPRRATAGPVRKGVEHGRAKARGFDATAAEAAFSKAEAKGLVRITGEAKASAAGQIPGSAINRPATSNDSARETAYQRAEERGLIKLFSKGSTS